MRLGPGKRTLAVDDVEGSFSRELEVLLCCCFPIAGDDCRDRLRRLTAGPLNWSRLCELAAHHRLRSLLYSSLSAICPDAAPPEVRAALEQHYRATLLRNLRWSGELLRVLQLLEGAGIPALPFKGPVLGLKVFGDLALREFKDLDVLVPIEKVAAALDVLGPDYTLAGAPPAPEREDAGHTSLISRESGMELELHWRFYDAREGYQVDHSGLCARPERAPFFGAEIRDLPPEEWLVILSIHGARHQYFRLHWLGCVAGLIRAYPEMDWTRVAGLAARWDCRRSVGLTLRLIAAFRLTSLPREEALRASPEWLARSAASRIAGEAVWSDSLIELLLLPLLPRAGPGFRRAVRETLATLLWQVPLQDRWGSRLRCGASAGRFLLAGMGRRSGLLPRGVDPRQAAG